MILVAELMADRLMGSQTRGMGKQSVSCGVGGGRIS